MGLPTGYMSESSWTESDAAQKLSALVKSLPHEVLPCAKGQVNVLSCGTKTFTWLIESGVLFTTMRVDGAVGELANTVWRRGYIIHSFEADKMLPAHPLCDSSLIKVDSTLFNEAVAGDAELSMALAEHYHMQFTSTLLHYRYASLLPSKTRLAMFEDYFNSLEELQGSRVDDGVMAMFMGMHRVSVGRLRRNLSQENA